MKKFLIILLPILLTTGCLTSRPEQRCINSGTPVDTITIQHDQVGSTDIIRTKIECKRLI